MELSYLEYLLWCFLGLAAALIYVLSSRYIRVSADPSKPPLPPGNYGWPVIGETIEVLKMYRDGRIYECIRARMSKHNKNIFKTSLFGEKTMVFCGAAGHKYLFTSEMQSVLTYYPKVHEKLFGESFLTAPYSEAIRTRKVITGFLKKELLLELVQRFDKVCKKRLEEDWVGMEQVSAFPLLTKYAFLVVCEVFTGITDPNWQSMFLEEFHSLIDGLAQLPINFPGTKFYRALKSAKVIRRELIKIIELKRSTKRNISADSRVEEQNLISYLLDTTDEQGRLLTDMEIANNLILLVEGGHGTTSSTIMLVIKYLAETPECYRRVLEEQREIAMSKGHGKLLNKDDMKKMKYSWNVVSEVLRLKPPVPVMFRKSIVDFTYDGFSVPKGWKILWNSHTTHMNEDYFPGPHKFDPSRFERGDPAPYTYIPFGGGPRICPGREFARVNILVFLHNLVTRFRWELAVPDEKIIMNPAPVASKGLPIYLYPHSQT